MCLLAPTPQLSFRSDFSFILTRNCKRLINNTSFIPCWVCKQLSDQCRKQTDGGQKRVLITDSNQYQRSSHELQQRASYACHLSQWSRGHFGPLLDGGTEKECVLKKDWIPRNRSPKRLSQNGAVSTPISASWEIIVMIVLCCK